MRASALLHDIGKIEADLGTWGRVFGPPWSQRSSGPDRARRWIRPAMATVARVGSYLNHPGDRGGVVAWLLKAIRAPLLGPLQHHKPAGQWTIPAEIAQILHEFDND